MPRAYQWTTLSLWCTITAGPWLSTSWRLRRWRTAPRPPCTTSTPARRRPCTRWSPLSCPFLRRSWTSCTCWAQTQVSFAPAFPLHTVPWPPCMSLRRSLTSSACWAQTQVRFAPAFPLRTVPHPPCATSASARCCPCRRQSPLSCPFLRRNSTSSTCWAQTQVSFAPAFPLCTVPHVCHWGGARHYMLGPDTGEFCPHLPCAYCAPCTSLRRSLTSSTCWAQTQMSLPPTPTSLTILCPALHACPWGWAPHSTCWAQTQVSPPPPLHTPLLHTVPCPPCMSLRMSLTSSTCWAQTQVSSPPPPPPSTPSTPHWLCDTWWWPGHFHFQVAVKCRFLQFLKVGGGGGGGDDLPYSKPWKVGFLFE